MVLGLVGTGKLGLPLALVFCKAGFEVCGVDVSEKRIESITRRIKFSEPQVNEYLEKYGERFSVSTDYRTLQDVSTVFVVAQTPSLRNKKFDLKYVKSAIADIHKVSPEALIVISSTINIGNLDILAKIHKRIAYNPEFIAQGSIIRDFENPKFTLIGAYEERDGEEVADIWRKIHDKPVFIVKPTEAEIIKLCLNVSFTVSITYANIVGELCEKFNADSDKILDIIYQDVRRYKSGLGFGGPCFPRDTTCLGAICSSVGVKSGSEFTKLLNRLNDATVERYARKILDQKPKNVAFIGVAYKRGVGLIDESQPIKIIKKLTAYNSKQRIFAYDKLVEERADKELPNIVSFCESLQEAIDKADVIFVGAPDSSLSKEMFKGKKVIDPWRCINTH
jgi:UDPglucose 6-dehydrogenase